MSIERSGGDPVGELQGRPTAWRRGLWLGAGVFGIGLIYFGVCLLDGYRQRDSNIVAFESGRGIDVELGRGDQRVV